MQKSKKNKNTKNKQDKIKLKPTIYELITNATQSASNQIKRFTKKDIQLLRVHMDKQVYKRDVQLQQEKKNSKLELN